jgi:hypothetical protein
MYQNSFEEAATAVYATVFAGDGRGQEKYIDIKHLKDEFNVFPGHYFKFI